MQTATVLVQKLKERPGERQRHRQDKNGIADAKRRRTGAPLVHGSSRDEGFS